MENSKKNNFGCSDNASKAYQKTLKDVFENGVEIKAGDSLSTGSNKLFKEIFNYNLVIENPRDRLVNIKKYKFNLAGAVARFIWMMAANNRIKDIEFYWGKGVSRFSDDGMIMPGSNYGSRMLTPRPGINQVKSIINRLKSEHSTRRAVISIYHPEDAVRESKDIPCAFGMSFHVRNNQLKATVLMRSNNASFLMPYNIFEFSLLAEVVAAEVGIELGSLTYHVLSMHLYEHDFDKALEIYSSSEEDNGQILMPKIELDSNPLNQITTLVLLEADIRHASMGLSLENIEDWIKNGQEKLLPYWRQFYFTILYFVATEKLQDAKLAKKVKSYINEPWKRYLIQKEFKVEEKSEKNLFSNNEDSEIYNTKIIPTDSFYLKKLNSFAVVSK